MLLLMLSSEFTRNEVETAIYGRTRIADETIDIYKTIANARSKKEDILQKSQDGGLVT
jgi:coenzyme F420-reducing hydrogenase beta subunit